MKSSHFNQLPLYLREALIFPEAKLMSSNQNERYRIAFFEFKGLLFEVCYELKDNVMKDIRMIPNKIMNKELEKLLFDN